MARGLGTRGTEVSRAGMGWGLRGRGMEFARDRDGVREGEGGDATTHTHTHVPLCAHQAHTRAKGTRTCPAAAGHVSPSHAANLTHLVGPAAALSYPATNAASRCCSAGRSAPPRAACTHVCVCVRVCACVCVWGGGWHGVGRKGLVVVCAGGDGGVGGGFCGKHVVGRVGRWWSVPLACSCHAS